MAACRTCGAAIVWATTSAGKAMPLDEAPTEKGSLVVCHGTALTVTVATQVDRRAGRQLFTSHFATCPHAAAHRRAT